MNDIGSIDPRVRRDLNLISRLPQAEKGPAPETADQVRIGQVKGPLEESTQDGQAIVGDLSSQESIAPPSSTNSGLTEPLLAVEAETPPSVTDSSSSSQQSFMQTVGNAVKAVLSAVTEGRFKKELKKVNKFETEALKLKTPAQIQAKTTEFRNRLAQGESLADIRVEAYAVARRAAQLATGMRPFDTQVTGALAMDSGHIAEMKTGEGKTLTAILPLYLNALAGKGAHLVTVNDTLAARDADITKPAFELLGLKVGTVLEGMNDEQRREGYHADVTYTTDRNLGFDHLRDCTARTPEERVQREPFFALVDEVDEVLLDEAQTPLIVSGKMASNRGEYQLFDGIVSKLKPGDDYRADPQRGAVYLTERGMDWLETQVQLHDIEQQLATADSVPERSKLIKQKLDCKRFAEAIRTEQAWQRALEDDSLSDSQQADNEAGLKRAEDERARLKEKKPSFELYGDEHSDRTRFLDAALKARVLFHRGQNYVVENGEVKIVDKSKGRTSEGRRFSNGLHQALEAKEGLEIQPEQMTTASITYPKLFKRYPRLSGMTGTAQSSTEEFAQSYNLSVVPISTNKPLARVDEPDIVFRTQEEKYTAVAEAAAQDFFAGKPVLVGTLSVEQNEFVAQELRRLGVPENALQVLNAKSVRGDKRLENEMISNAGRSGVITVATNMAGRGADIKPDMVNFKKVSMEVATAAAQGKPVVVEVSNQNELEWMNQWLADYKPALLGPDTDQVPSNRKVVIRMGFKGTKPTGGSLINTSSEEYQTGGFTVYGTERAESRRIDDQLIGRAGRQGAPGRSKFFLSLEDELFKKHGGSLPKTLNALFTSPGQGLSGKAFEQLVTKAQENGESTQAQLRKHTNEFDSVLDVHRGHFYSLRNEIVEGKVNPQDKLIAMSENAVEDSVLHRLPDKKKLPKDVVNQAISEAEEKLGHKFAGLSLPGDGKVKTDSVADQLRAAGRSLAEEKIQGIDTEEQLRNLLLDLFDTEWAHHLDAMEALKGAAHLQTLVEQDSKLYYQKQGLANFESTLMNLDRSALDWALKSTE